MSRYHYLIDEDQDLSVICLYEIDARLLCREM